MSTSSLVARLGALCLGLFIGLPALAISASSAGDTAVYDCASQSAIPQPECAALVALYNANPGASFSPGGFRPAVPPARGRALSAPAAR